MMRLLVVDQYSALGGAQRCLLDLVPAFRARGWEVHAGVPAGPLLNLLGDNAFPIPAVALHSRRKTAGDALSFAANLAAQARVIRQQLRSKTFDAIYVNGPRLLPPVALAHGRTPVIFHAHNRVEQPAARALLRLCLRLSGAAVIASSRFVAHSLAGATAGRLRVEPNGVAAPASRVRIRNAAPTVAVLGRIEPEKGQLEFALAAGLAGIDFPQARFAIAGAPMFSSDGYAGRVSRAAAANGVSMIGWVDDASAFLAAVDLLVVPSDHTDATPRVVLEAHAASTPVLAFASGGIPEMITDGENGILVGNRSAVALGAAIVDALSHPEELARIAHRAFERWQREYTLARFQAGVCRAIQDTVERRHQRNPLASAGTIADPW